MIEFIRFFLAGICNRVIDYSERKMKEDTLNRLYARKEQKNSQTTKRKVEGVIFKSGELRHGGRIYPREVLEKAVKEHNEKHLNKKHSTLKNVWMDGDEVHASIDLKGDTNV